MNSPQPDANPYSPPVLAGQPRFGAMEMAELRAALSALGFTPSHAAAAAGDDGERVPVAEALAAFDEAAQALGDPWVGLHAAARVKPRGALVHLMMSAASLQEAIAYVCRFSRLLIDALSLQLQIGKAVSELRLAFDQPLLSGHRQLVEYCLLATCRVLRAAVGENFALQSVSFRHAAPSGTTRQYEELFGGAARFNQPQDALVFDSAGLKAVPVIANPFIARQMEELAQALASRHRGDLSVSARTEAIMRSSLAAGRPCDRAVIARELAMSEATLTRRLAAEGTQFRALREELMWELADALLANPGLKIEGVARSLGFNDAAAFSRALKRRTGTTPGAYRKGLQS